MNKLKKEFDKVFARDGITAFLPQNLSDKLLNALLVIGSNFYYNKFVESADENAYASVLVGLWKAAGMVGRSNANDLLTFAKTLQLEDCKRRGYIEITREFTLRNVFDKKHTYRVINKKAFEKFQTEANRKIIAEIFKDSQN